MPAGDGPDGYLQTAAELVEERVPAEDRFTCSAPRGSLVFCDTVGLHRGGYASTRPRLIATWAYYRPAALATRDFRCVGQNGSEPRNDSVAFALA
jgi:hypothetical protein